MSDAIVHTATVDGWSLTYETEGEEPLVHDLHLAEHLEFTRPRDIRKLIERLHADGTINDSELCATVAQTGGRPANAYRLTESGALKVIAKSETKRANEILDQVIRVYIAVRRGLLRPTAPTIDPAAFAAVMSAVVALSSKVDALTVDHVRTIPRGELRDNPAALLECRRLLTVCATVENRWSGNRPCISKPHARLCKQFQLRSYRRLPWPLWAEAKELLVSWIASPPDRVQVVTDPRQARLFEEKH